LQCKRRVAAAAEGCVAHRILTISLGVDTILSVSENLRFREIRTIAAFDAVVILLQDGCSG
jgi:hypothetical protein